MACWNCIDFAILWRVFNAYDIYYISSNDRNSDECDDQCVNVSAEFKSFVDNGPAS